MLVVCVEHDCLMRSEFLSVFANWPPLIKISGFGGLDCLRVTAVAFILVVSFYFLLIDVDNVQIEFAYFPAAVLEPKYLQEIVHVETILVCVALKKLSLSDDVILSLFFLLFVHEVGALACLVARFGQVWRDTDKVLLVALWTSI